MTSGAPLYLVSACGSAEEFVAAFRRYADRTGLFIPSAAPLPAGRRGRIAVTLKDGGVMIEGEAEILQSSSKPTVLYGRPGMTVKFVEPDEPSKVILGELEKARLAMKVPAPSVPPRPSKDFPTEPRAVPPPAGGRIDATNALAECVVIGDPTSLRETASGAGPKPFVVPSIPGAPGARPKSPSVPPIPSSVPPAPPVNINPKMTSIGFPAIDKLPANAANPAKTTPENPLVKTMMGTDAPPNPTKEIKAENPLLSTQHGVGAPKPSAGAPATSASNAGSGAVRSGAPATPASNAGSGAVGSGAPATPASNAGSGPVRSGAPAAPASNAGSGAVRSGAPATPASSAGSGAVRSGAPATPASNTGSGAVAAPAAKTGSGAVAAPAAKIESGPASRASTVVGPPIAPGPPPATPPKSATSVATDDESTSIGEMPPKKTTDPMPTAAPAKTGDMAAAKPDSVSKNPTPNPDSKNPTPNPDSARGKAQHKATSIGFPALRTPFETQAVGVVPPPSASDPKPKASLPQPRAKSATTPPLTPRHPTPVAPLPIVKMPVRQTPIAEDEDEKTDLSNIPSPTDAKQSGAAALPAETPFNQIDPDPQIAALSGRSGGMRASEIMAAIPTEDWTMTPDASGPTVLPSDAADGGPEVSEPTPAPGGMPKGPPTGNWTISLDPETGWQEPQKLAATPVAPPPPAPKEKPKSGNPDIAIASDKAFTAVEWEEKPTGIGEAKIEIDPTLMEPLKPMPALDDDDAASSSPGSSAPPLAAGPGRNDIPPPLAPMPIGPASRGIPAAAIMTPAAGMPMAPGMHPPGNPTGGFPGFAPTTSTGFPQPPVGMNDLGASGSVFSVADAPPVPTSKKRMIIVAAAAGFAVIAGFALVLMLSGGKHDKKTKTPHEGGGSAAILATPADAANVVPMHVGSAGSDDDTDIGSGAGSAQVAIVEPHATKDAGTAENPNPPTGGTCKVDVASVPTGADVYLGKQKLGTAPGSFDLPCGSESTLSGKKAHYISTDKAVTPAADKPNKVVLKLGKTMFSLKVTSTPAGATITAGGKNAGVTPATIKVPGFEASTITLTKPGYTADTSKVTPKSNGQAHHVVLKKKGR